MFWFALSGSFLLRFDAVQFAPWLFQLPPRITRSEPLDRSPACLVPFGHGNARPKGRVCA
jgi:hypothetical protein